MAIDKTSRKNKGQKETSVLLVPHRSQHSDYMCGPRALQMLFLYHKKRIGIEQIAKTAHCTERYGTSIKNMIGSSRQFGFRVSAGPGNIEKIEEYIAQKHPVIVNYIEPKDNWGHYAVVVGVTRASLLLHDPWMGPHFKLSKKEFMRRWCGEGGSPKRWMMIVRPKKLL